MQRRPRKYRKHTDDNRLTAMRLADRGLDDTDEICRLTDIPRSTFYDTRRRYLRTGRVSVKEALLRGRPRSTTYRDTFFLLKLAKHNPTRFLDEYAQLLERSRLLSISISTVHRCLARAGLVVKQAQKMAGERTRAKIANYIRRIGAYSPACLVFLDETAKDDRTYARLWGRAQKGQRVEIRAPFVRKRRFSLVGALALDEPLIGVRVLEGAYTHDTFYEYLRDDVVRLIFFSSGSCAELDSLASSVHTVSWSQECFGDGQCSHSQE